MKVTQSPKTGKLIVDGEGAVVLLGRDVPADDPIEKITNFIFRENGYFQGERIFSGRTDIYLILHFRRILVGPLIVLSMFFVKGI